MSREAFWSLMGMYNYDNTLLANMNYPTGWSANDKEHFLYDLLTETAELEVIYNDPAILKTMIGHWSAHRKPIWDHLIETTQYEYDPIANWDRHETESRTIEREGSASGQDSRTTSGNNTLTLNRTDTETGSGTTGGTRNNDDTFSRDTTDTINHSGTDSTTNSVNGFVNSTTNGMAVHDRSDLLHGESISDVGGIDDTITRRETTTGTSSNTNELTKTGTEATQSSGTDAGTRSDTHEDTETLTRTYTGSGNIGTMTSQQMIKEEREIADFDITNIIIDEFKKRFLILIY